MRRIMILLIILTILLGKFPTIAGAQEPIKMTAIELSPDGTKVAIAGDNGYQAIWDLATNKQILAFNVPSKRVDTITWSPDGTRIASASALDGIIRIWDSQSGSLVAEMESDGDQLGRAFISWSPDGARLATSIFSETAPIKIWGTQNDSYALLASSHSGTFFGLDWSPDSRKLAIAAYWSAAIVDDLSNPILRSIGPSGITFSVAWSPDGSKLAIGGKETTTVVNVTDGKEIFTSAQPQTAVDVVQWSSDGNYLETASHASTIKVWDATTWKLSKSFDRKQDAVIAGVSVVWSRSGGRLLFLGSVTGDSTVKSAANDALQIAVPIVSSERLAAITKACVKPNVQQQLTARISAKQLTEFANDVKGMSKDQVPPACAADLIAVSNALQSTP